MRKINVIVPPTFLEMNLIDTSKELVKNMKYVLLNTTTSFLLRFIYL